MPKLRQKSSLTALEQDVLTLLRGKKLYGLQIMQGIEAASQGTRTIKYGSLYPLLAQLEAKGWVRSIWGDEKTKGARRRYYAITPAGEDILQETQDFRYVLARWKA